MITEAATKKKGRPEKWEPSFYEAFSQEEKRTAQNTYYASRVIIEVLKQRPGSFFVTEKGKLRRQGIAEKIGRMLDAGTITEEEAATLAEECIQDYQNGTTVKEIEKKLAALRDTLARL